MSKRLLCLVLALFLVVGMIPAVAAASSTAKVYDIRVNDLVAPVGIDDTPTFSWKMESNTIGAAQTAYNIVVADPAGTTMWDTGWVESGVSVGIKYAGEALASSTEYTVAVKIKDQDGNETAATSTFEMGLLEANAFADTKWISYQSGYISDTTTYTIDFDFSIDNCAQGFCFGMQNTGTFVMWQVNSIDNAASDKAVLLRPHFKANGNWTAYPGLSGSTLTNKDVTDAIGYNTDNVGGKTIHERIEVNGKTIKTYFGPNADNLTLAYEYTHTAEVPLYNVGFRHSDASGEAGAEASYFDNLVVRDGAGKVLYSNDFSESVSTQGSTSYSMENGMLHVYSNGEQVTMITPGVGGGSNIPAFRKSFTPAKELKSAKLYTSGLGVYESYINGQRVGRKMDDGSVAYDELKPGFTEMKVRKFYNTYDVTWMLSEGENVLSAVVSSGWWSGPVARSIGNEDAYLAKLILTYTDGTQEVINTDTSWKTAKAAALQEGTGIFEGERYDARVDQSWMNPGYDDSAWGNAKVNTEFSGKISAWSGVPITVREELELSPKEIYVYEGTTGASSNYHGTVNIVRTYKDGDDIVLNPGETLLVDLGQNFAGWEAFDLEAEAGTTIHVVHGEMLNDGNGATSRGNDGPEGSIYNANYRSATADTIYIAGGYENESYHPSHTFYGFRYAEFTADKTVTFTKIRGQVVTSSQEDTGVLVTSDKDVNQLVSNVRWGMYSNYLSVPTDCPQRDERQGWTADTQNFAEAGCYMGFSKSFLEKFMEDMRDTQRSDGAYPGIAPTGNYSGASWGALGWADAGVIVPYFLYVMYGDTSVITENWESMKLFMDKFMASTNGMGGGHAYGDWLAYESNDTTIKNMLGVSYYAWDALLMSKMASAIGLEDEAQRYMNKYEEEKALFQSLYVQEDGTLIRTEQSVNLYALFLDLLPNEESVAAVTDVLISNIERNGNKLQTGFLGTEIIMHTLTKIGRTDVAYKLLLQHDNPSWLYSVDQGATTIWERWNSYTLATGFGDVGMNSFNHYSYGSVASWMFRGMAGIGWDESNPGFKHFVLAPAPDQSLPKVEASYESAYGTIVSNMNYVGAVWNYDCTIPANTTATIKLPVEKIDTLTANGKSDLAAVNGLTYKGYENGIATFEAVAGTYSFSSDITKEYAVELNYNAADEVMPPVVAEVTADGETRSVTLPATLMLKDGSEVTIDAAPANAVDYVVTGWSDGTEGGKLVFTVSGEAALTADTAFVGLANLAEGKPVTASQVNASWAASNLTDGAYSHLGGTNGWSSPTTGTSTTFAEQTAVIDFGGETVFNRIHLYPRTFAPANVNFPTAYTIYVSNDNATWTPVYSTESGEVTNGYTPAVIELEEAATARYVKLGVTGVNASDENGNVYVQMSEMGVYNTLPDAAIIHVEKASEHSDVVPMNIALAINGETKTITLPGNLSVSVGDEITMSAELLNTVDYAVKSWTLDDAVISDTDEVTFTVSGDATLKLNIGWNGYNSLAIGKTVIGNAVNSSWGTANLVDGKLSYLGGTNGWSSNGLGTGVTTFAETSAVIDLGAETQMNRFHIYPRNLPSETEDYGVMNFPVAYTIYVSNDNATWKPVYATTNGTITNGFEPVVVELEKSVTARYVKYGVTAINQPDEHNSAYVQLSEFGIYNVAAVAKIGDTEYTSVQAAVNAASATDVVKVVADTDETVTVAEGKTLHLDLNGFDLAKVINNGTFYGMDTTTDDYDCEDGYGKIGAIEGDYEQVYRTEVTGAGKRYAAVAENDGVSFHRFYVGITHMALRPGVGGAGYTMTLAGDSKIKSIMTTSAEDGLVYGYTVSLANLDGSAIEGASVTCSGKQEDFLGGKQKMTALTLDGVLKAGNGLEKNKANAENYLICVESFVMLNGEKISTNKISMTFKDIVLATDAALQADSLTEEQKDALLYLYNDLGVKDMGWELENLSALAAE